MDYSSSILGDSIRPPIAAVVMDMIEIIEFFESHESDMIDSLELFKLNPRCIVD